MGKEAGAEHNEMDKRLQECMFRPAIVAFMDVRTIATCLATTETAVEG